MTAHAEPPRRGNHPSMRVANAIAIALVWGALLGGTALYFSFGGAVGMLLFAGILVGSYAVLVRAAGVRVGRSN